MSHPSDEKLFDVCVEAAKASGTVLAGLWGKKREITHKGRIDLVTDADKAAEKECVSILTRHFPDHSILAEESGARGTSPVRWIVDPLDGTTNYAHGVPHFSVSIACEVDGVVRVGVVYNPISGELFAARKGAGAFLNNQRVQCTTVSVADEALMATGFPYYIQEKPKEVMELFAAVATRVRGIRRFGSAALDLAYVAAGRFDGFFENGLRSWDMAAGALLVHEAGGIVTRMTGAPLDLEQPDVLASGKALHPILLGLAETRPLRFVSP
jgi:myo-inositol-1(or 4)-monophosphatase